MELSYTEENYLKTIFQIIYDNETNEVGTNELALNLSVTPSSVNDMLKKLKEKKLVHYEKYKKIKLTIAGRKFAVSIIRKHRLWETFLYSKLGFSWDEVHEIAEELEHIKSEKLINKLDEFLGFPEYDPHGEVIPDKNGFLKKQSRKLMSEIKPGIFCKVVAVKDNSVSFLQYVDAIGLNINTKVKIISIEDFDGLTTIEFGDSTRSVSRKFASNILVV